MYKRISQLFSLIFIIFNITASAQSLSGYFMPPLEGVLQLSGTFAELRGNHFHSGIDIRTGSKEGLPVRACADGYVVRIKVQQGGFGKAVYINHPNGYTTVYAHLLSFNDEITNYTRAKQYENESFEVDLFPPKDFLRVSKGDIIASSGNSGASEGPHLHFEVRETDSEFPVDPLLFDFPVKDWIRPTMHGLRIYPEGPKSSVNGSNEPVNLSLAGWGPVYRLKISDTVAITGRYSLGISATDLLNETSNRNGVVRFEVYIDSVRAFEWKAEKFSFNETRYINSFIDYPHYYLTNQRYMRTHVDPGNKLSMYSYKPGNGVFTVLPGSIHYLKVVVADSKLNESVLRFVVKGSPYEGPSLVAQNVIKESSASKKEPGSKKGLLFTIDKTNTFATPGMRISLPGKCLYDSIRFDYSESAALPGMLTPVHQVHNPIVPLQESYDLSIKVDSLPGISTQKLTIVRLNSLNRPVSVGGKYENGYIKVKTRDFGRYSVMVDTTAPVVKPVNIKDQMEVNKLSTIQIAINDNFSGIRSYRGTLNNAWILMDYDAKNRLLTYEKDALLLPGQNILTLTVTDWVGNTTVMQWKLNNSQPEKLN